VKEAIPYQRHFVVVHYVTKGLDAPPLNDDNGNKIPDYVEKTGAAAQRALQYYGAHGFKSPLPDTGGMDRRPDIYLKALPPGIYGVTVAPTKIGQGSYMVISPRLDRNPKLAEASLQGTVAHEMFHVFQFSYVPNGAIPGWAAEGSASGMATEVYPHLYDVVVGQYVDEWLSETWRSLHDERFGCDHCYGGALWWRFMFSLPRHVMSEYFGRLYGYQKIHRPIRNGLQALDEILSHRGQGSLYLAFSRFSYDIYRAGYRPSPYYTIAVKPGARPTVTPVKIVQGLSTHYVPIKVPAGSHGLALAIVAAGGPNPDVKLVLGGPRGRALTGAIRLKGHERLFMIEFRNASERRFVTLIVTSGRERGVAYRVAVQAV
jgi:hypothetical protein